MVKSQDHEGHDLCEPGQCRVKPFNLSRIRRARRWPMMMPAAKTAKNPDPMDQRRHAVQELHAGEGSQRIQGLAGKRNPAHEPEQGNAARDTSGDTDRHLKQEVRSHSAKGDSTDPASG
jgi:hypothetical protein